MSSVAVYAHSYPQCLLTRFNELNTRDKLGLLTRRLEMMGESDPGASATAILAQIKTRGRQTLCSILAQRHWKTTFIA